MSDRARPEAALRELELLVRSLAWRLVLRDPTRTLREKEVEGRRQKLLKALESELGVR